MDWKLVLCGLFLTAASAMADNPATSTNTNNWTTNTISTPNTGTNNWTTNTTSTPNTSTNNWTTNTTSTPNTSTNNSTTNTTSTPNTSTNNSTTNTTSTPNTSTNNSTTNTTSTPNTSTNNWTTNTTSTPNTSTNNSTTNTTSTPNTSTNNWTTNTTSTPNTSTNNSTTNTTSTPNTSTNNWTTNTTSPVENVSAIFSLIFRIQETFDQALANTSSPQFTAKAAHIISQIDPLFKKAFKNYRDMKIRKFWSGSTITESNISMTSSDPNVTETQVESVFFSGFDKYDFIVDPSSVIVTQIFGNSMPPAIASSLSMIWMSLLSLLLSVALHF